MRQALQAQIEDGAGLGFRQVVGAVGVHLVRRIVDQRDEGGNFGGGPAAGHQAVARLGGVRTGADGAHHLVHIRDRHGEPAQHMRPLAGLAQLERGSAHHNFLAEGDEMRQKIAQGQRFGPPAVQGQHVAAKADLQGREAVKLVQHDIRGGVALEFDHHTHADPVGFVGDTGDAFEFLFPYQIRDLFDHRGLVDLIGHLVHHDGVAVLADFLDMGLCPDQDRSAPFQIGLARAGAAKDGGPGREIGAGDDFHQPFRRQIGVFDQGQRAVDHLAQIVRRDARGHADGDAFGAVDQHVGKPRGQDRGFAVLAIVVVLKIDRVLVDVGQQETGRFRHAHFGIAERGRRVAIHGAKVALTVQQHQRHRERLRHAHQRIIDRAVAMRVILAHRIGHRARGLAIGLVVGIAHLVHRIKDAAMHRLQAIPQIRDGPRHDHRHGIVEIGRFHLGRDIDLRAVMGCATGIFRCGFNVFRAVAHGASTLV